MKKRLEEMQIGDDLCDMHDGLITDRLKNEVVGSTLIRFPAVGGCEFISKQLEGTMYCNKLLVMVGSPEPVGEYIRAVFAYSYDDRSFGVVQLMAKPSPE